MLLHVIKTKEGLTVLETPHKTRADYYMKKWGKDRKYIISKKITKGK